MVIVIATIVIFQLNLFANTFEDFVWFFSSWGWVIGLPMHILPITCLLVISSMIAASYQSVPSFFWILFAITLIGVFFVVYTWLTFVSVNNSVMRVKVELFENLVINNKMEEAESFLKSFRYSEAVQTTFFGFGDIAKMSKKELHN